MSDNIELINIKIKKNIVNSDNGKKKLNLKKKSYSMKEALEKNEVLLWGLNKIDSIILNIYEIDYIKKRKKNINKFNPNNIYTIDDIEFLNQQNNLIENKLNSNNISDDEYEKLLDLQDKLIDIINNFKNNITDLVNSKKNIQNSINLEKEKEKESLKNNNLIDNKTKKKKFKPYYFIGNIPEGFRESTEEEAILNKKVSFFGKKKVSRELYNLYEITGILYIENLKEKEINRFIIALKGKSLYYKKKINYNIITLNSGKIIGEDLNILKEKINTLKNSYDITINIMNSYIKNLEKIK